MHVDVYVYICICMYLYLYLYIHTSVEAICFLHLPVVLSKDGFRKDGSEKLTGPNSMSFAHGQLQSWPSRMVVRNYSRKGTGVE